MTANRPCRNGLGQSASTSTRCGPPWTRLDYGVINWFNNEFGFGFITPDSDGVDVFVHISQIPGYGTPEIGQRVSYRLAGTPRRPEAKTVNRL